MSGRSYPNHFAARSVRRVGQIKARPIRQIAALPYRIGPDGLASVLLITSRGTGRWVIPKGNPIRGLAPHEAAAHEALEEAGITGIACPAAIGTYRYAKRRKNGTVRDVVVTVFPLAFTEQLDDWLEQDERDTRWFDLADAAAAVDEPDLQRLIAGFRPPPAIRAIAGRRIPVLWGAGLLAAALIGALLWAGR